MTCLPLPDSVLHNRLRNCLQTILDLEAEIRLAPLGDALLSEFVTLKEVMGRLNDITINEHDVERIEEATSRFLFELKDAVASIDFAAHCGERLQ